MNKNLKLWFNIYFSYSSVHWLVSDDGLRMKAEAIKSMGGKNPLCVLFRLPFMGTFHKTIYRKTYSACHVVCSSIQLVYLLQYKARFGAFVCNDVYITYEVTENVTVATVVVEVPEVVRG